MQRLPPSLVVAIRRSVTVQMQTDAIVAPPDPLRAAMQAVVVGVPAVEVPVSAHVEPLGAGSAPADAVAIAVAAIALVAVGPEPA